MSPAAIEKGKCCGAGIPVIPRHKTHLPRQVNPQKTGGGPPSAFVMTHAISKNTLISL
jgi:hypothetical protein